MPIFGLDCLDYILEIPLSMVLHVIYHFSYSQQGCKGTYHYRNNLSVTSGYGASGKQESGPDIPRDNWTRRSLSTNVLMVGPSTRTRYISSPALSLVSPVFEIMVWDHCFLAYQTYHGPHVSVQICPQFAALLQQE